MEGGGEGYAPGKHVKEGLRTIQLWLWGASAWPAPAEYVHRNIQLSISNICVIRGCTSSFLLFIKLHEHRKYVYAHTHILSLFIVSFHSLPLFFFYCVLVFYLSSSRSISLPLSQRECVLEREMGGREEREEMRWGRGGEMRSEEGRHMDSEGREEQYERHSGIHDSVEWEATLRCWINLPPE